MKTKTLAAIPFEDSTLWKALLWAVGDLSDVNIDTALTVHSRPIMRVYVVTVGSTFSFCDGEETTIKVKKGLYLMERDRPRAVKVRGSDTLLFLTP